MHSMMISTIYDQYDINYNTDDDGFIHLHPRFGFIPARDGKSFLTARAQYIRDSHMQPYVDDFRGTYDLIRGWQAEVFHLYYENLKKSDVIRFDDGEYVHLLDDELFSLHSIFVNVTANMYLKTRYGERRKNGYYRKLYPECKTVKSFIETLNKASIIADRRYTTDDMWPNYHPIRKCYRHDIIVTRVSLFGLTRYGTFLRYGGGFKSIAKHFDLTYTKQSAPYQIHLSDDDCSLYKQFAPIYCKDASDLNRHKEMFKKNVRF